MSAQLDDLLIRKLDDGGLVLSMVNNLGIHLTSCPMLFPTEVKEPSKTEFPDEHGVDTYNGKDGQLYKAFDATFKFVKETVNPTDSHYSIKDVLEFFNTGQHLHDIYCPWAGVGRKRCRFKSIGDISQHMNSNEKFVLEFSLTLTIEDPYSEVYEDDF